ncbi:unnamed protein product [Ceutorhynchus assimilis]|uniref:Alpha-2-macroglobulin bait region domain-containing protein n=1 Tax=Ceutorhynchus assimilis TaxID=467358 RepID=A0A9N9QDR9_9CUCU|nr:unnamed protein product [Ceutorhynchus assimilis]
MYKFVIIAVLLQICLSKNIFNLKSNNNIGTRKKATGFVFSMPKTLVSGKNETVCISLHELNLPAKVLVDLKWKEKHHTTLKNLDSDSGCFEIKVPLKRIVEAQFVSVRVQVQMRHQEIYSAHNYDPILIYPSLQNKVLIETDRGLYKPGDTLKFRILQLDRDFLPISTKISNICIKNPMGITVMAWENITPDRGLVSFDYQLVPESMIGKWKLQAENQTTTFEVAKYNVPRFKIDLKYPKSIYYKTKSINILVCGKYSNNKPVAGIAFIKISHSFSNMKSINELKEMVNGCAEFQIDKATFGVESLNEKMFDSKKYLQITATITEHGTNKMDVASGKSKILLKGYNLKFNSNPMFIPGMPYEGQLKLTNIITSIEDEVVEICYNLAIKKSWNYLNKEQCRNYSIPKTGIVAFKLWPVKTNVLHVSLHAKSLNNSLITDDFLIVRLFSPSSSYIKMEKIPSEKNACYIHYQYKVAYSTDHFNNGDNITFYYTIKSSLEILEMGKHNQTVQKTDTNSNNEDTSEYLGEVHKYVKLGANIEHFTLNFQIKKKFLTGYQLLIYYVTKDGETVAATKTDEIEPCSLQISSNWSQTQLLPGTMATLNIKSASPALCAISVTDKASKFISANHQNVSLDRILKVFSPERESAKSGRNSCVSNQPRRNAGPSSVQNMEHLLKRRKRHIYSFAEDYDAYDIFSKFGTITITNLQLITKPCYNGPLVEDLPPGKLKPTVNLYKYH